jgi:hypothetical protein
MQKKHRKLFNGLFLSSFTSLILIISLSIFISCGKNTSAYDPQAEYKLACADAARVTPAKISKNLTAIVPENTNLIWENNVAGSRVLVVSWVKRSICDGYKCPAGGSQPADTCKKGKECPYGYDTYVTLAPELKNFFGGVYPTP